MADLAQIEIDGLVSYRQEYGITAEEFARDIGAILADYAGDRSMQTLHLIRYRYYLEHRNQRHQQIA